MQSGEGRERAMRYSFHAFHLSETFRLKSMEQLLGMSAYAQSATKLVYREHENGFFFLYRFGSVIFFNIDPKRQQEIIERVKKTASGALETSTSEEFSVELDPKAKPSVGFERAVLDQLSLDRIELLSLVIAQSTALEHFENRVDEMLRETGEIGQALRRRGRLLKRAKELKRFMGRCIMTKQNLVASLYLLDKPDEIWEDQTLDALYREAVDMFEIRERYKTVDYKLRMIQENLGLIAELLQYKQANFLEWAIIVLIAIEIVLFVVQLFILE